MTPAERIANAAIRQHLGENVLYTGAGLAQPTEIRVIWSDVAGAAFEGPSNTTREISAEIDKADLPQRPGKADRILRNGVSWKPIEAVDRDDIESWAVKLERD